MKVFLATLICLSAPAHAWVSSQERVSKFAFALRSSESDEGVPATVQLETENPCWEEFYDDDCAMRNIYSANFVASKWIKSMPCGEGIEVRRPDLTTRHCANSH